ncbi:MAG: thiamine phosphate synthase [Bosea sp. (in: a-proteobacteria)]
MRVVADLSLYYVTDTPLSSGRGLVETALAAVRGGATLVQLRDPVAKAGELVRMGRALKAALDAAGVPLIINDRPDIALAIGAAGVHVGQDDMPPDMVRALLGPDAIIGLSVTNVVQMQHVPWGLIDHVGVGPVISKGVKPDAAEPMGLNGLRACVNASHKPIVAIGGIGLKNAAACIAAGADGVAVVAALAGADDPEAAARALRAMIDEALAYRSGKASAFNPA